MLLKATGLEQLGALLAGALVALGGFLLGGSLAAVAASRPRLVLRLAAINAAAWLATALGVWLLVSRLAATDELSFGWLLGAYATAWLAGFLVPFAPGGLGFREGALAAFLAEPLGTSAAVTVALAVRLASTVGELIAVGAVELVWRRRRPR